MNTDYGYINARLRAMKSYLFKKEDYAELLENNEFSSFFQYLQNSPSYSADIKEIQLSKSQWKEIIDKALKSNFVRNFRKIINFSAGSQRELILFILRRWDIYNLKIILRKVFYNLPNTNLAEIMLPLGELDENFLTKLVEQTSLEGIINILCSKGSIWSRKISWCLRNFKEKSLREIENNLEILYWEYTFSSLNKKHHDDFLVAQLLELEVDFRNILHLLDYMEKHIVFDKSGIIPGGKIPSDFILNLSKSKNIKEVLDILANSYYKEIFSQSKDLYQTEGSLCSLENFLKRQLLLFTTKLYRQNPLNIGVALGYLQMKEAEIINLRILNNGFYYRIEPEILAKNLILN